MIFNKKIGKLKVFPIFPIFPMILDSLGLGGHVAKDFQNIAKSSSIVLFHRPGPPKHRLHKGEGEAWRHLGGLGRINHVYRIRVQGFGKNVGGGDSKVSFLTRLHGGCSFAAYPLAG